MSGIDIGSLLAGEALDAEAIKRLKSIDRGALKTLLETYLPDVEVERMLARIDALIASAT